ncbi:MAG: hypothetical protein NT169_01955, partial [Chloroflexi bacterium]|nr:hypothetical protein [Chloroflexota bacterium]
MPIAKAVAIGFLITELVTWGLFAYQLFASGLKPGSMAANFIFATEVAATITGLIMLAIAAIPIVGQIIAAVIGLFDSIVLTVCGLAHSEHPVCQGISGWMVYGIRWVIYSGAIMVNLDDDERLKIHEFSQDFLDSALGMAVGNSLVMEATIRNRIELIDWKDTQSNWMAGLYWWQYSDDTLRSSTFVYHLDAVARDYHERLARNSIRHDEWTPDTDGAKSYTYSADVSAQTRLTEDGINLGIPLYLNEGFAVPAQECWLIPIWFPPFAIPVCYIRTEKASSNINLGEHMRFDIFPPTLDGFYELTTQNGGYALAWSQDTSPAFPRLKDADGDGLRDKADGGADPNDLKWDTDGDGLSDFYEVQIGTNPQVADTDHDGLTDYQEVILGTDPLRADSDYDGLTDGEEVAGWEFVYDFTADGSQLKTWVTSDPLSIDGDGDTLTDFQEKTFGFNPRVPSDLNVLTFSSEVTEQKAPRLLLRLDELDGANAFRDDSGYAHNAACPPSPLAGGTEGGCPLAGHQGKYGNAPQFDGSNDYLEVAHTDRLNPDRELTLAAWVQLDHPGNNQKIVGKTTTGNGYLLGVAGGQLSPEIWDSQGARTAAQWGSIPAGTWTHIAVTWRSGGKMTGYVNGNRVGDIAASANPIKANTGPLRIGIAPWNATAFPAGGRIDEVVMIPRELTQAEIVSLAAGRHNPEDLTVRPGDVLDYRATVTNKLFNRYAQGLLSANFPAVFSEPSPQAFVLNPQEASTLTGEVHTGQAAASGVYTLTQEADALITDWREASNYADMLLHLDEAAGATTFEDSAGAQPPRDGACDSGAGQCPTAGEPGRSGYALHFDGVNDLVAVKNANTDNPQVLTIAAWVYPDTLPSRVMRFVSLNGEKAVLRYDGSGAVGSGQLNFYMKIG